MSTTQIDSKPLRVLLACSMPVADKLLRLELKLSPDAEEKCVDEINTCAAGLKLTTSKPAA